MTWIDRPLFSPRSALVGLPAALVVGLSAFAAGSQQAAPGKIGVVDMDALLQNYPGLAPREAEFEEQRKKINTEIEALEARRKELQDQVEQFVPGTDQRLKAERELSVADFTFRESLKMYELQRERMRRQIVADVYVELRRAVADWATKNGYDLVMRSRPHKADAPLAAQIDENQQRDLLWHAEAVDVTRKVIDHLKVWTPR